MPGISVKIDASRVVTRLRKYAENVRNVVEDEWPAIVSECIGDILSRTPDPGIEYDFLMGADSTGTSSQTQGTTVKHGKSTGQIGHRSNDTDSRIRFNRSPGYWLRDLVTLPGNVISKPSGKNFYLGLGNVAFLELNSKFSWVNQDGAGGTHPHISEYGTWSFFEYGLTKDIRPRQWGGVSSRGNARGYKLSPSEGVKYWEMTKRFPRFSMYGGFDPAVFRDAVRSRIRAVQF